MMLIVCCYIMIINLICGFAIAMFNVKFLLGVVEKDGMFYGMIAAIIFIIAVTPMTIYYLIKYFVEEVKARE